VLVAVDCEVAVVEVDHRDARAHEAREREHRDAGAEREGGVGVAQVVEVAQRLDSDCFLDGPPVAAVEVLTALTSDREELRAAIENLGASQGTPYYDALERVAESIFRDAPSDDVRGRRAVVALTDGVDSSSNSDFATARVKLSRAGVACYFIQVNTEDFVEERLMKDCNDDGQLALCLVQDDGAGAPVDELDLTEGGDVVIQIHPKGPATVYGKVIRVEPLEVLELTWDVPAWRHIPDFFGTIMRWEVRSDDGGGSKLFLTHSLPEDTSWHVHAMLGAWHLHLDALPATLAGEPIPRFEEEDFFGMRDEYAKLVGPVESLQ